MGAGRVAVGGGFVGIWVGGLVGVSVGDSVFVGRVVLVGLGVAVRVGVFVSVGLTVGVFVGCRVGATVAVGMVVCAEQPTSSAIDSIASIAITRRMVAPSRQFGAKCITTRPEMQNAIA